MVVPFFAEKLTKLANSFGTYELSGCASLSNLFISVIFTLFQ